MEITGKLLEVKAVQQISDTFKKREFIVEYAENPQYPEYIKFELIQEKCALVDDVQPEQMITVNFNLKGRKWVNPEGETIYFNSLQAWKVTTTSAEAQGPSNTPPPPGADDEPEWLSTTEEDGDDLPF